MTASRKLVPPGFSTDFMDRSVSPAVDFYQYAVGSWIKKNPVPPNKSRWGAFEELNEFNFQRLRTILERAAAKRRTDRYSVEREVGDFHAAATDLRRRDRLRFRPIASELAQVDKIRSLKDWSRLLGEFHHKNIPALFDADVAADRRNSRIYALYLVQGGLSLPDRDYYLRPLFSAQRKAFRRHVFRSLRLLGESESTARRHARIILEIETDLAKTSRSRTDLRDREKNYHKTTIAKLRKLVPSLPWDDYFAARGAKRLSYVVVGQPEFFRTLGRLLVDHPISHWRAYARWSLLRSSAPFLHSRMEREYFQFYRRTLLGQLRPEPLWKRAAEVADRSIGDSLGQLFVHAHFPPTAATRMRRLVEDLRGVFRARLQHMAWMTPATRRQALAKFDRFKVKIGHPRHFRDDSRLRISRRDYVGNLRRAAQFEDSRRIARIGRRVDPDEWQMTVPMVNAYFDSTQNEIVFPAGILQPPFFDRKIDDAVNYGGIGYVIGHEITHGYDDQGRRSDLNGNLNDWWTPRDAREFRRRARRVVAEYDQFEPLPGAHIKGALTLGENIADIGGVSIAFEAFQKRLARNPRGRTRVDGLTPEQRFFISVGQVWRETAREPDVRRLLTIDTHSPGRFRVQGSVVNTPPFFEAFDIRPGAPMWRAPSQRIQIW